MEIYRTKGELLESVGRDKGDVRWVDRQMTKGVIEHCEDGYYFVMEYLKEEVERLKKEEKSEPVKVHDDGEVERLKQELYEAKTNSDYWEKMYNEEVKDKQNRIRKAFLWIKNIKPSANWEEFRDWILNDNE